MLANYDRDSTRGLGEITVDQSSTQKFVEGVSDRMQELKCTASEDKDPNCQTPLHFETFPDAVKAFLKETGYID